MTRGDAVCRLVYLSVPKRHADITYWSQEKMAAVCREHFSYKIVVFGLYQILFGPVNNISSLVHRQLGIILTNIA